MSLVSNTLDNFRVRNQMMMMLMLCWRVSRGYMPFTGNYNQIFFLQFLDLIALIDILTEN